VCGCRCGCPAHLDDWWVWLVQLFVCGMPCLRGLACGAGLEITDAGGLCAIWRGSCSQLCFVVGCGLVAVVGSLRLGLVLLLWDGRIGEREK